MGQEKDCEYQGLELCSTDTISITDLSSYAIMIDHVHGRLIHDPDSLCLSSL